ncbi:MAG: PAS domain-containing protein [Steroidobacter sp.]
MAEAMRAHDWERTALGPPSGWPVALKVAVNIMLDSPESMFIAWGPGLTFLCNDAFQPLLRPRRKPPLGQPLRELWFDSWGQIEPIVDKALAGIGSRFEDLPITLTRPGGEERTWWTFSYSPVRDETGAVVAMMGVANETTTRVLGERRHAFVIGLQDRLRDLTERSAIAAASAEMLGVYLGAGRAGLGEVDPSGEFFTVAHDWTDGRMSTLTGRWRLNDFSTEVMTDCRAGRTVRIDDVIADKRINGAHTAYEAAGNVRACIAVPLLKNGRFLAAFYADQMEPRLWTDDDEAIVREVAERTWAAMERAHTDLALAESERRYRALFNAMDEGFCIIEFIDGPHGPLSDYVHIEANPAYAVHAGITNVVGQKVRAMVGAEAQGWIDLYASVLHTGRPIRFERELEATGRWLELAAFRVEPPERNQVAVLFQDLTARKRAETALRELNETLEARVSERSAERDRLWRLSEDMLARADYMGMMSAVSPAWTRSLGWTATELLSRPYATFMHSQDAAPTLAAIERMRETAEPTRFENRIATRDGSWKPIEWTVSPEPDGINFIAVGRDLSATKAREAEMRRLEEALRQSQKMEAVGQLTGGLAHDFNNLLTGISGSLELVQARVLQGRYADVDRYVLAAQSASKRAASLTHRLLAFSRRQTLDPRTININALIAGMEELIRRTIGPSIAMETVSGAGIWSIHVDPNQLENALLNLAINARDAMPEGGKLTIETANRWLDERAARERDLPAGQYVSMCVSDNGVGMTPEVVAKAFDPFFTTKPIGLGTGLGLSMIYGFARQSGGQARIYSELGKGTMVCIYMPRHLGDADSASIEPDAAQLARSQSGETVLIIDDEPLVRMLVVDTLEELGYAAIEAADGAAGLKVLESDTHIDLLVTDVGLPNGMNGRQVADAARQLRPGLKVLFITGFAENAVLNHGHLEHGMHVVTKPFEIADLSRKIRSIILDN